MSILIVNAGSSSVKLSLFDFESLEATAQCLLDWGGAARQATIAVQPRAGETIRKQLDAPDYRTGVAQALRMLADLPGCGQPGQLSVRAIGHRLIHGGTEIREPVAINAATKKKIRRFTHLAPLHIPPGLEAIEATEAALPGVFQVGLFDTAFFGKVPPEAYLYPVPYEWYQDWGIRRFGFHGTSHAYCTARATEMLDADSPKPRLVICHLGQGSSATAVRDGVAITNTMGFTPLEGLMMGTRSGTVDPGILLHVQRERGVSVEQLDKILHHQSGLLGLSGVSSDFRQVEAAAASGHQRAKLALDVYAYRVRAAIGALAVALGGLDGLVFTGGIGENSALLRASACRGLECLGARLDQTRNLDCQPDADVAQDDSSVRILVIHTREYLLIARETRRLALAAGA